MRDVIRLSGLMLTGVLSMQVANAQTCAGLTSLEHARMNVAGTARFSAGSSSFGARLTRRGSFHGPRPFLAVGIASTSYEDIDDRALGFSGTLGFDAGSRIEWCPLAGVTYEKGPGADTHTFDLRAGVAVANAAGSFAPFARADYVHRKLTTEVIGATVSGSDDLIEFSGGIGVRFRNGMQITPQIMKSSQKDSDLFVGAMVSVAFGKTS
jgi:hypothetical protein